MDNLIAELEAAPEGSRDLDGPLFRLHVMPGTDWEKNKGLWWPCEATFCKRYEVHPYTTSLDAALTLVPEEFVWRVSTDFGPIAWAALSGHKGIFWADTKSEALTAALALCIAALKARQAMEAA